MAEPAPGPPRPGSQGPADTEPESVSRKPTGVWRAGRACAPRTCLPLKAADEDAPRCRTRSPPSAPSAPFRHADIAFQRHVFMLNAPRAARRSCCPIPDPGVNRDRPCAGDAPDNAKAGASSVVSQSGFRSLLIPCLRCPCRSAPPVLRRVFWPPLKHMPLGPAWFSVPRILF